MSITSLIILFSFLIILISILSIYSIYKHITSNITEHITYKENSSINYKVYLKENQFFEKEYAEEKKQYIASLIEYIKADFNYTIDIEKENVDFQYVYGIKAEVNVKEKNKENMGYILELRRIVGQRPLIMTCAGVLIVNEKNQLLLQRRKDNGLWGYPGGSMELGERFEDCAVREVLEETGLTCLELEHFMNVSGECVHYIYPNGDEIYAAEEVFLCRRFSGELQKQVSEVMELRFFDVDRLPEKREITPNNFPAIDYYRNEYQANEITKEKKNVL